MRYLDKAYDDLVEKVNKFFSKDELLKRARNKLLTGDSGSNYGVLMSKIPTQDGSALLCKCIVNSMSCSFGLAVPSIEYMYGSFIDEKYLLFEYYSDYSSLDTNKVFNLLNKKLEEHRKLCMSNIVAEFGSLKIGYYNRNYNESKNYLVGVVNNEIVFMFVVKVESMDISVELKEDEYLVFSIPFGKDTGTLSIRVDDYSIV